MPKRVRNIARLREASGVVIFSEQVKGPIAVSPVRPTTPAFYAVAVSMHQITQTINIKFLCRQGTVDVATAAMRKRGDYRYAVPFTLTTETRKGRKESNQRYLPAGLEI